ncbi:hypothetical protein WMY93_013224 [Mugilogobius chulae]|uniref:Uncharacterized protein n=1 Tax=Mugilogobius chulae TaxID=88201 RepID=A0AAW0P110_9GOBI
MAPVSVGEETSESVEKECDTDNMASESSPHDIGNMDEYIDQKQKEACEEKDILETSLENIKVQLSAAEKTAEDLVCQNTVLEETIRGLQKKIRNLEEDTQFEQGRLMEKNETLFFEVNELQVSCKEKQEEIEEMAKNVSVLRSEMLELQSSHSETKKENEMLSAKAEQLDCKYQQQQAYICRLSELIEDNEHLVEGRESIFVT